MGIIREHARTIVKLNALALGTMFLSNKYINSVSSNKNMLKHGNGTYFRWSHGDVFYHKYGSGSPVLLIHELDPAFSSYEWTEVVESLSANHTVYTVDLPGCGRSYKEATTYTNYFYVLFLTTFIKNVIKKKCTVITSGYSASFAIMASSLNDSLIGRIIAINPKSMGDLMQTADRKSKAAYVLLSLPIIGTSTYNIAECRDNIDLAFSEKYMYNPFHSQQRFVDAFYEAAHFNEGKGKYLLASIKGKYITVNIKNALKKKGDILTIVYGEREENGKQIADSYQNFNASIKVLSVYKTKRLPHMERPDALISMLKSEDLI